MTARLDARQLEQVWDAQVLGERFPLPVEDLTERELFELLAETAQPAPSASFVRELERELALASVPELVAVPPIALPLSKPHISKPAPRRWNRPRSRWMTAGYALAAIALIVLLSSFAIARQRSGEDNGPSIPAVSIWNDGGPVQSSNTTTTTFFDHAFTTDQLQQFDFDQWGWIQFMYGEVAPHAQTGDSNMEIADTMIRPGVSIIGVQSGELAARVEPGAFVVRGVGAALESVEVSGQLTLAAGDSLIFGTDMLTGIWNPTDATTSYVAGGMYSGPDYPINFHLAPGRDAHTGVSYDTPHFGTSIDTSAVPADVPLRVTSSAVTIQPGGWYGYETTSASWLMAFVTGDGLVQERWHDGSPGGEKPRSLMESSYTLHNASPGTYALRNTGNDPVTVYLFDVAPESPLAGSAPPSAAIDTIFEQAFSQSELTPYQLDQLGWIQFLHAELDPGHQWPVIDGSNATPTPGWPGLSVVGVVSGQLTARLSKPILISRAGAETLETVAAPADVILAAGDSILFEPGAVESIWNLGEDHAELVDGGLYDRPHYASQTTGTGALGIPGGSSFDPAVLAGSPSLDLSLRKISIAPGEDYRYTITPRTLLLADVRGAGLQKTAWVDGTPGDTSQRLLVSKYTLHNDNPGDYRLTNTGEAAVDVYFFGVSALSGAEVVASPTAQGDGKG